MLEGATQKLEFQKFHEISTNLNAKEITIISFFCFQYYCEQCWANIHSRPGREFHKPLVKEGADRPRTVPFRWCQKISSAPLTQMKLRARVPRTRFRMRALFPRARSSSSPNLNSFCNIFAELPTHEIVGNSQTEEISIIGNQFQNREKKTFLKYLEVNLLLQLFKASLYEKL